jgi:ribonuclease P protein component
VPDATPAPDPAPASVTPAVVASASVARLRSGRDIDAVFGARHRRGGRFAVLHAHRPDGAPADVTRVAVVASRRVGSAVRRNRAKRLLREAARRTPWIGGVDAVLIARADCAASSASAVTAEVVSLASALGITTPVSAPVSVPVSVPGGAEERGA